MMSLTSTRPPGRARTVDTAPSGSVPTLVTGPSWRIGGRVCAVAVAEIESVHRKRNDVVFMVVSVKESLGLLPDDDRLITACAGSAAAHRHHHHTGEHLHAALPSGSAGAD